METIEYFLILMRPLIGIRFALYAPHTQNEESMRLSSKLPHGSTSDVPEVDLHFKKAPHHESFRVHIHYLEIGHRSPKALQRGEDPGYTLSFDISAPNADEAKDIAMGNFSFLAKTSSARPIRVVKDIRIQKLGSRQNFPSN